VNSNHKGSARQSVVVILGYATSSRDQQTKTQRPLEAGFSRTLGLRHHHSLLQQIVTGLHVT
jgi:hypothetical protein